MHCAHGLRALVPPAGYFVGIVLQRAKVLLAALIVARGQLHIGGALVASGGGIGLKRQRAHIDVVVAGNGQVNAAFVHQLPPAPVLACEPGLAMEPLVVFAHHSVARGGGAAFLYDLAHPLLRRLKSLGRAHVFTVEHYKQHATIGEVVAHSPLALVAIGRIIVGVAKIVAGELVAARHVVVIAVESGPHGASEGWLPIQLAPKRVAAAPGYHVAYVQHPVHITVAVVDGLHHVHGTFEPIGQRSVGVEVAYYAGTPLAGAGCGEAVGGAGVAACAHDSVLISGVGLEAAQSGAALEEACVFGPVAAVGPLAVDAIIGGAPAVLLGPAQSGTTPCLVALGG